MSEFQSNTFVYFKKPELSPWQCYLFGALPGEGLVWRPLKGQEPGRFWRWMQFLAFGNRWVKDKEPQP